MTEGPDETVPLESAPYGAEGPVDGPRTLEGEVALFLLRVVEFGAKDRKYRPPL